MFISAVGMIYFYNINPTLLSSLFKCVYVHVSVVCHKSSKFMNYVGRNMA